MKSAFENTYLAGILVMLIAFTSCTSSEQDDQNELVITCTTSMIRDAAERVAGDHAKIIGIMGPGVDPHTYKATQGDLGKLRKADIVFYNGLHLEGKMQGVLEKLGEQKPTVAMAGGIEERSLMSSKDYPDAHDPHIWFDLGLWSKAIGHMGRELASFDSIHAKTYQQNTRSFQNTLDTLHQWTQGMIGSIPEERKVMITAHDAFRYFGRAYNIQVKGLQGLSTASEHGLRDVTNMVDLITERNIKAIFIESSVPSRPLEAVINACRERDHEVEIGGTLYSDAMGKKGTPEDTFPGMVEHNVKTIVKGLR